MQQSLDKMKQHEEENNMRSKRAKEQKHLTNYLKCQSGTIVQSIPQTRLGHHACYEDLEAYLTTDYQ